MVHYNSIIREVMLLKCIVIIKLFNIIISILAWCLAGGGGGENVPCPQKSLRAPGPLSDRILDVPHHGMTSIAS